MDVSPQRQAAVLILASGIAIPLATLSALSAVHLKPVTIMLLVSLGAFSLASALALLALAPSGWVEGVGPSAHLVFWAYVFFVAGILVGAASFGYVATQVLDEDPFL